MHFLLIEIYMNMCSVGSELDGHLQSEILILEIITRFMKNKFYLHIIDVYMKYMQCI